MKKKITMKALVDALKNDIFFTDAKTISRDATNLTVAYKKYCIIEFSIIGDCHQFLTFSAEGFLTSTCCSHLVSIMNTLEGR